MTKAKLVAAIHKLLADRWAWWSGLSDADRWALWSRLSDADRRALWSGLSDADRWAWWSRLSYAELESLPASVLECIKDDLESEEV